MTCVGHKDVRGGRVLRVGHTCLTAAMRDCDGGHVVHGGCGSRDSSGGSCDACGSCDMCGLRGVFGSCVPDCCVCEVMQGHVIHGGCHVTSGGSCDVCGSRVIMCGSCEVCGSREVLGHVRCWVTCTRLLSCMW